MQENQLFYILQKSKICIKFLSLFLFLITLNLQTIWSQQNNSDLGLTSSEIWELGMPLIENFTSDIYKNNPQNWDILEGNDGFMYFGNTSGILQFDGSSWSTIELENKNLIRSLTKKNDKVYFGGTNELGYLEPDQLGAMQIHTLSQKLDASYQEFGDIWKTIAFEKNVFFMSQNHIFRWDGKNFKTWYSKPKFGGLFKVNNNLFTQIKGVGIHKIENDSLVLIPSGDDLKNNISKINVLLPYTENKMLLVTANQGILVFDGKTVTPFNERSNKVFLKHPIYKGILLSNGDYAMATTSSGLFIIDAKTGNIKQRLGKQHGLISDVLFNVYEDSFGSIWVGSDNGIAKIDWESPFRRFNKNNGLTERVRSVSYQNNEFLVDSKGLFQLKKGGSSVGKDEAYFKKIKGIDNSIRFIIPFENKLLAFHSENIFKIDKNYQSQIIKKESWVLTALIKSTVHSSKIYAGTLEGKLYECSFINNTWSRKFLLQIEGGIEGIIEESNGNLWLQTYHKGLYYANSKPSTDSYTFKIKKYDTLAGLPSMNNNFPFMLQSKVSVSTQEGMYYYEKKKDTFIRDTLFMNQYDKSINAFGFIGLDKRGNIWQTVRAGFENKIFTLSDDILSELYEYNLFNNFSTYNIEFLDDIIVFTGPKGVLLYNQNKIRSYKKDLTTKLRKIWINNDSLIYAGTNYHNTKEEIIKIPFGYNDLKFEYTLPYYNKSENNSYQYILEGYDKSWSSWSSETKKDYTNIPEGDYSFKVRSKNILNHIGNQDTYSFTILPPWHRTWWAYLLYGLGAIGIVVLYSKWRSKELQKKNVVLENTINNRTLEIRQKNELLNHQTEQLVQLNESKTKLYSNITHEFRTPLTVILGMADTLKTNVKDNSFEGAEKSLEMIRRNGKNLLHLINELLDLAKVESGNLELKLIQTDVIPFVKYLSESFHSLAEAKKINLTVYSEIDTLEMDIDVNKMASIISNLLSNAIKFTSAHGKIIVHLNKLAVNTEEFFAIKVQDNGRGLKKEDIPHLFDRFYQVNDTSANQEGTGIGLSLTKEFIELMNGAIAVEGSPGKGSTFTVQIPVTNKAVRTTEAKITSKEPIKITSPVFKKEQTYGIESQSELPLVLIIEDNEDVAHYLKTCLKSNYQTIHALNGDLGIKMAYEHIPDIVISDVMMPIKDGLEVCGTLKADERTDHIPIILLTAKVTTQDRLSGLTQGADAYLAKPFLKEELFTRLDQLILVRKKLIGKLEKYGLAPLLKEKVVNPRTKFLQQVIITINDNLDNVDFGPTQLAKKMHLSESQVYRKLKSITNKSTAIFIRSVRLQKAKELIQSSHKTISEISYDVGFNDPSWFSKAFKEEFGYAPSQTHK